MKNYYQKLQLVKNMYRKCSCESPIDNYSDPILFRKILGLSGEWFSDDENKLKQILLGTAHHRDFRNIRQYAFNLILNWLVEDLILQLLEKSGLKVTKEGSDANRDLLMGKQVSAEPDLMVIKDNENWIEVIANYPTYKGFSSFWEQEGFFDLRDNKYLQLLEKSKYNQVFVVGVVVSKSSFFILHIDKNLDYTNKVSEKNFGYKKTTKIEFDNGIPILIPLEKFVETFNEMIKN